MYDDNLYSFSGLQYMLTEDLALTGIAKDWDFGVRFDWVDEKGKNLAELFDD